MAEASKTALEFLEQLRRERDDLDVLITGIEKRLGIASQEIAPSRDSQPQQSASPKLTLTLDSIPVGFFHNLSQVGATEKLLKLNPGQPLSTNDILEAFRKSGMQMNPKNAVTILYTALKRSDKFERIAKKAWGLSEWYPADKKRKKEKEEDETNLDDPLS